MSSSTDLVIPQGQLKKHEKVFNTVTKITCKLKEFPRYQDLKMNIELTIYAGCLLENLISKKYNIDKKELLITILKDVFDLNAEEVKLLDSQIDFLLLEHKIKKISNGTIFLKSVSNFFLRNFHF
jgi:hypothetical protein